MFAGLTEIASSNLPLALVAAAMVSLNVYILYRLFRDRERPQFSTMVLAGAFLLSQLVFWAGLAYYLESPTVGGFVVFALAAQAMMVPVGLWFVTIVFEESENVVQPRAAWPVGLTVLVFGNELFMSWTFVALVPGALPSSIHSISAVGQVVVVSLGSLWYYWPMGITMAILLRWSRFTGPDARALAALTATAFVAPWAFEQPLVGAIAMSVIMVAGAFVLWQGMTVRSAVPGSLLLRASVGASFLAMSLSWIASYLLLPPSWGFAPFAGVMAAVMIGESYFLIRGLLEREFGRSAPHASAADRSHAWTPPSPGLRGVNETAPRDGGVP